MVYNMKGHVTYLNPAFTRIFGWTLEECLGKKMDHFVPVENWDETYEMIDAALAGETFTAIPSCHYNKAGNILHVSISGSIYSDHKGELAGSVIILRDITKSTRLRRQLMNIVDRERHKIGQDLHDDLCPHLIGIQGLGSVLEANLGRTSPSDADAANQIVTLIGEAVEKTRSLTRGLCPVHMVSHGLETALRDIVDHTTTVSGITCEFHCDGRIDYSDYPKATHLYYIAQEALNNAIKHSNAQIDLIKEISSRFPGLPVLVLSMYDESLYAERALQAGARGYIMKQEAIGQVAQALRSVLNGQIYASAGVKEKAFQRYFKTIGRKPIAHR